MLDLILWHLWNSSYYTLCFRCVLKPIVCLFAYIIPIWPIYGLPLGCSYHMVPRRYIEQYQIHHFGTEVRVQIRPVSPAVETKEPPCHAASECKSVQVIVMHHTFNSGTVLPSTHRHWMMVPLAHAEARVAHACHQASPKNGSQVSSYRPI